MAWNVMEQLNANAKKAAVGDNTPKAHFRTQDVSINKMYSNDKNFYSVEDIEPLAQKILLVGLMENLEVVHDPCDRGEYRIIAGERRWRALKILVEKGYTEFEKATCQIQTPASEEEETLRLIIANDYRNKTVSDLLEEEDKLKKILQQMKENGQTIMGIDLNSGRIRDVVAYFLKIAPTKVAQIESINKHLIPEFSKELKEGRLTFSAAYMISGMNEETQAEMLERYQENGLTYKEVKEIKQEQEEKKGYRPSGHAADNIPTKATTKGGEVGWTLLGDAENWFYMKFVEWGTTKQPPQDFLYNTMEECRGQWDTIADQEYQKLLNEKLGG